MGSILLNCRREGLRGFQPCRRWQSAINLRRIESMFLKNFGPTELIIILVIVLVLFGVGRLGRLGKDLGEGISAFRRGIRSGEEEKKSEETDTTEEA
jgi:sec-independent protein translocase protein TatA